MKNKVTYTINQSIEDRSVAIQLTSEDWEELYEMDSQIKNMMKEYELAVREKLGRCGYSSNIRDMRKHMQEVSFQAFGLYAIANN